MRRRLLALAAVLVLVAVLAARIPWAHPTSPRTLRLDVRGQRLLLGRLPLEVDPSAPLAPRPEPPCSGTLRPAAAGGTLRLVLPAPPITAPFLFREGIPGGRSLDCDWHEGGWTCRLRATEGSWSLELTEALEPVRWTVVLAPPLTGSTAATFRSTGCPEAGFRVTPLLNLVESVDGTASPTAPPTRTPLGDLELADEVGALATGAAGALPPALFLAALALVLAGTGVLTRRASTLRHPATALTLTLLPLIPGLASSGGPALPPLVPAILVGLVWWGLADASGRPLPLWRVLGLTAAALGLAALAPLPGTALLMLVGAAVVARPGESRGALRGLAVVTIATSLTLLAASLAAPGPSADFTARLRACGFSRHLATVLPWGEPGFGPARATANLRLALAAASRTLGPTLAVWPLGIVLLGARSQHDVALAVAALLALAAAASAWRPDVLPACVLALLAGWRALLLLLAPAEDVAP